MGVRWQTFFPKLNFTQLVSQNVKILSRILYSPSLKNVAYLEDAQLSFPIFHTFDCKIWTGRWMSRRSLQEKNADYCIEN